MMRSSEEEESADKRRHKSLTTKVGTGPTWPKTKGCLEPLGIKRWPQIPGKGPIAYPFLDLGILSLTLRECTSARSGLQLVVLVPAHRDMPVTQSRFLQENHQLFFSPLWLEDLIQILPSTGPGCELLVWVG